MGNRSFFCPACGEKLEFAPDRKMAFCPFCGNKLDMPPVSDEERPARPASRTSLRQFTDDRTGVPLAAAAVPDDYLLSANLREEWQSDTVPFTILAQAASPDREILLVGGTGESHSTTLNPLLKMMVGKIPGSVVSERDFIEPEQFVQEFAISVIDAAVTPVAETALPSRAGQELPQKWPEMLAGLRANLGRDPVNPIDVANFTMIPILIKFRAQIDGRRLVVLAGMDYVGSEQYAIHGLTGANGIGAGLGGAAASMVSSWFGGSGEQPKGAFDWLMKGGLLGQMRRNRAAAEQSNAGGNNAYHPQSAGGMYGQQSARTSAFRPESRPGILMDGSMPFGHASEYGKRVDSIEWACSGRYAVVAPEEREQEATEIFLKFVRSFDMTPEQQTRWKQMVAQKGNQMAAQNQMMQARTAATRMDTMRRQRDLSRQIARNSQTISAGIMDSYEKRSAMQDRTSRGFSEAIRGVNTYTTSSGSSVEVGVSADHVYENRYGDVYGVSGDPVDEQTAARLDWTELDRQD